MTTDDEGLDVDRLIDGESQFIECPEGNVSSIDAMSLFRVTGSAGSSVPTGS